MQKKMAQYFQPTKKNHISTLQIILLKSTEDKPGHLESLQGKEMLPV